MRTEPFVELEDVVVVATRHEQSVADAPYTVYRRTAEDYRLRLQVKDLADALQELPGVMNQKTGHGMTSPFLRGFTGQRVVLLSDGVRLNNSTFREGPNQYWSLIDACFYDDVELLMGPSSVLYGSDAIGGVVLARSRLPARGVEGAALQPGEGAALLRYSSAEKSFSEHLRQAFAIDDIWSFKLGLTRQDFGDLTSGGGERNPGTAYEQWGGNLRAVRWFDDDARLVFGIDHWDQDDVERVHRTIHHLDHEGTSTIGGTSDLRRTYDHDREAAFTRYESRNGAGVFEEIDLELSWQRIAEEYHRIKHSGDQERRHTTVDTLGARLRLQTPSAFGTWNYGADIYHDFVSAVGHDIKSGQRIDRIQGEVADDSTYTLAGIFIQHELPLGERFELTTGIRYTYAEMDAGHVNFSGEDRPLRGHWDAVTASGRLLYRMLDQNRLNLYAGVSQGFRAPNLSDATRDGEFGGGVEAPTADLDSERFTTWEAGIKSRWPRAALQAVWYYTDIRDQIFRLETPVTKRNLDKGYNQGVELSASCKLTEQWLLFGSFAWQEGRELTWADADLSGPRAWRPLSRQHPLMLNTGLRYAPAHLPLWIEAVLSIADDEKKMTDAERGDNRFPPDGTPGYEVLDLRAGYALTDNLDLAIALENVTDESWRIHGSGINEPGRNLVLTMNYRW